MMCIALARKGRSLNLRVLERVAIATSLSLSPLLVGTSAIAQILPDNTLGSESSIVTPGTEIQGLPADLIQGGAIRQTHLFHSFSDFNVQALQRVYFANPQGIENILTRITGQNPSHIHGLLGVDGSANLFLLNPNGILFGNGAQLDIAGSFIASTADSFHFPDGSQFSAVDPQAPPLLTINLTPGLQYGTQPAPIINSGNLAVGPEQNLTLAGGTAINTGQLTAPGGTISVVAIPANRLAHLSPNGQFLHHSLNPDLQSTSQTNPQSAELSDRSLAALLQNEPLPDLNGLADNQIEFTASGTRIAADPGTTLVSGHLNTSAPLPNQTSPNQTGGTIQVLGSRVGLVDDAQIDASGAAGGGTVLIGGNFQGNGPLPNAQHTLIEPNVTLKADAQIAGDGGTVIVWADEMTRFFGDISARGGANAGNGGLVEVSGKADLQFQGLADTSAAKGETGTLLLDPDNIVIVAPIGPLPPNALDGLWSRDEDPGTQTIGANAIAFLLSMNALTLQATNSIVVSGDVILPSTTDLTLRADNALQVNANIISTSGGSLFLDAGQSLSIDNSTLTSLTPATASGGNITLDSPSISLSNNAAVVTSTVSAFKGGDINLNAQSITMDTGATIATETTGVGAGGAINLDGISVSLDNGATVVTRTSGTNGGQGGPLTVNASESVEALNDSALFSTTQGTGDGGDTVVNTRRLRVENGSGVLATAFAGSSGRGGDLTIKASESIEVIGNEPGPFTFGTDLSTAVLLSQIQTGLATATAGSGSAGDLTIETGRLALRDGAGVSAGTAIFSTGNSGNLAITATAIDLQGKGGLSTGSIGSGSAGNLRIDAERVLLRHGAGIATDTIASGEAGSLMLNANRLDLRSGSRVGASTSGSGQGGTVLLNVTEAVEVVGTSADGIAPSGVFANSTGTGNAGNLRIDTRHLQVREGGEVSASTTGPGQGGSATINAAESVTLSGTNSRLTAQALGIGSAGNLFVNTQQFVIEAGAEATASTSGSGQGGTLMVNARSVELDNQASLLAQSTGAGKAGSLTVRTGALRVMNQSQVAVSSLGTGNGGTLDVEARNVLLDRQGRLIAETASGDGGNIRLRIDELLLMRRNSLISATAGGSGNGGNIDIEAMFAIAVPSENSDIIANAFQGQGGSIDITAQGILGLRFRTALTPLSDITASSQLGVAGTVQLNTPDVDPSQNLAELPDNFIDPSQFITAVCSGNSGIAAEELNEFSISGRGGLPASPDRVLRSESSLADWVSLEGDTDAGEIGRRPQPNASAQAPLPKIVEAQGWIVSSNGNPILTANVKTAAAVLPPDEVRASCAAEGSKQHR